MKRVLVIALLVAVVVACGKKFGAPLAPDHGGGPRVDIDAGRVDIAKAAHMAVVAVLHERAIGPYIARSDKGGLAAYIAGAASGATTRAVVAVALDATGAPTSQARVVAQAALDTSTLVVRRVSGADAGYLLVWTSLTDRGESLNVVGLTDAGEPRASAIELARTTDHMVWVEVVPTSRGAVCIWAEEPPSGTANVLTQALDASGRPRGVPSRSMRNASSWQAVATHDGVGLAIVQAGTLSLARIDTEGRVVGEPLPVAKNVGADMDLVRAGDTFVFAWTDKTRVDPQLVLAGVDAQNKVVAAHDALPDAGTSSLVTVASGDGAALVLWEPAHKRERITRRVQVATLHDAGAPLVTKTMLDVTGGIAIEARSRGDGWALLGAARACPKDGGTCGASVPTFVRLDAALAVVQTEALVQGPPVSLAWGIDCAGAGCLALAAGPDVPTDVYAVDLSERASTHMAPVASVVPDDAPRLVSTRTLTTGSQVSDIASGLAGDVELVASIVSTGYDEKTHDERVALRVTPVVDGKGQTTTTVTTRALATGGLAMAAGPGPKEVSIAYVAKDGSVARVHVAHIDEHGARRSDIALPGGPKGDASDVSIVTVPGGHVVAWVDTRDGNGEVYACKITGDVPGLQVRITNAPGDATDTALTVTGAGGNVVLAWADPRESPHDGFADIYAVALSPQSAKPLAKEGRVLSTAAHSRSPVLARTSQGAALAWIEEAPAGAASEEAKGAMFALLDDRAHPVRDPIKLHLRDPGVVTAITLDDDPSARLLHAVVARVSQDELWLDGARIPLDAGGSVESYPLLALDGPSSMDVALGLRGDELVFSDEGGPDDARVKRGQLAWKKSK
jgi:hypothetical protein